MHNYGHWKKTLALLVMSALSLGASSVDAMPEGGVIRSGEGAVTQNGKEMTIRQDSGRLAMDWTNFNVGKDETVRFQQPGKDALALNRVTGNQQSIIDGSLLSNGHVLLVNPNGVVIGKNASIDVGGLVASTAHVKDNFMKEFGNSTGAFTLGGVSDGKIINEGTINAEGGLVALHAAKVENSGTIKSNGGSVLMAAADTLTLTPDTDGKLNFTVDGKVAEASALNKGAITADGGTIVMTADSASDVMSTVVNNEGTLQARTLRKNEKGQILLEGNDKGQVEVSGTLDASGEGVGQDAGNIKVIGQKTIVHDGTNLLAKGNVNGGKIETSGDVLDLGDNLNIDAKGVNGKAGEWLLDPLDVIIADGDPTGTSNYDAAEKKEASDSDFSTSTGTNTRTDLIGYNDPTATSSNAQDVFNAVTWVPTSIVKTMLEAGTNVRIQAVANNGSANIIVKNNIEKTSGGDATLTLEAMRNITINGNITATGENNKLNVILNADTNGDATGAVIINADIKTNGGNFTSASGGKVTYAGNGTAGYGNGTLGGEAEPTGHTVGTYFGHVDESGTADGEKDDRLIQTNGGKITLNGEVAIGLNGGTLTLDSSSTDGTKGDITVTGIINSGNSYGAYVYGTTIWDELTQTKVDEYLANGKIPAYHYQGINYQRKRVVKTDENGNPVTDANGNLVYATDANGNPIYEKDANGNYVYLTDDNGNYIVSTEKEYYTGAETHYTFTEQDSENVRWPSDGTSTSVSTGAGYGYSSVIVSKGRMTTKEYLQYLAVSDPDSFLAKYMVSGATISIGGTNYTLARGTKSGVNYLGYQKGNSVVQLTTEQLTSLADGAAKRAENKNDTTAMKNGSSAYTNLEDNIRRLLASNWFESAELAQANTGGGSKVGDSYLATITTILENSLTTPNGQQILWAGGMGSGVRNKKGTTTTDKQNPYSWYGLPDDPTHQNGMYWVTGPEGKVTNSDGAKGTQFYSNVGSDWNASTPNYGETVYGYANWDTYKSGGKIRYQPDNSAPFLTVGYGTTGKWDDAAFGGDTTIGFIKETNLANSSLNIKAGSGEVKLGGDIGKAKALDTVNIESTGAVTVGTDENNNVTDYYHGTIYADHGVYISSGTVSVGGEIHSGTTDTTASASDIKTRTDGYQNEAFQLDNVTIKSAGDLTVHGVESDGYTDSDKKLNGGKISLTSTGDKGKITLGAGVDYDGKATAGTLAAASTEKGAVVIDAQGSQGSLVNSTDPKSSAITTGTDGTWQVYVNSPSDYGTSLGSNLISGTNAQWTAKSTANTNSSTNTLAPYTYTSSNKFIFQVTPVITISGGYASKTYGDKLSEETMEKTLTSKATYKDSNGNDIDVTKYDNFVESKYLDYVTSSDDTKKGLSTVNVSSDGAATTATRTKGDEKVEGTDAYKTATDGNRAFYIMDVTYQDGVKTLNGYDKAANDGEVEITRKTLTISTDGTQTYGNTAVTNGKLSYDKTQLVNGDSVDESTLKYTIATDGTYAASKGSNDTAHVGDYDNQYLTTGATVKASDGSDASANYEVTGSGTITVTPADLYLTVGDVSTTYGTAFNTDNYTYTIDTAKGGFVNKDTQDAVLGEKFLNYTNTGAKTDASNDKVKTQNAGSYVLQGSTSKDLSDYTVHITNGKSTVEKAKLTLTVGDTEATYGSDAWTPYTYTLQGNTNGDTVDGVKNKQISVTYTNGGEKSDASNKDVKTQDVGSYDLRGEFTLSGDTAVNYEIDKVNSKLTGTAKVNQAEIHLKLNEVSTTYGTAFTDTNTYGYDPSQLEMANGDDVSVVTRAITNKDINYTNTGDADPADKAKGAVTKGAGTGYELTGTTEKTLQNYKVVVDKAKSTVTPANITLKLNDVSTTYGSKFDDKTYGYNQDTDYLKGILKNGDDASAVTENIKNEALHYNNTGAVTDADKNAQDIYTADAGDNYTISSNDTVSLQNYNVTFADGNSTVNKAKLKLKVNDAETIYGTPFKPETYSYTLEGNTNGDSVDEVKADGISAVYTNDGAVTDVDKNTKKIYTKDANGDYHVKGAFTLTGKTFNNYEIEENTSGKATINKATVKVKLNDVSTTYGTAFDTSKYGYDASNIQGLTNGDDTDVVTNVLDGTYGTGNIAYTNTGDASEAEKLDGKVTKTVNGGPYYLQGTTSQTLGNYNIEIEDGSAAINKATLHLSTGDYEVAYGAAGEVTNDLRDATTVKEKTAANGDNLEALIAEIGIKNTSDALLKEETTPGTGRTADVKYKVDGKTLDSYPITTDFKKSLDNYNVVLDKVGSIKLTPIAIKVTNEMIQTYGSTDKTFKEVSMPSLVNGDTISADGLTMKPKAGGAYETNRAGRTTADAGTYYNDLESDGGGIVHENGNDARKNYSVTIEGDIIVNPKDITTRANGTGSTLDNLSWDVHNDSLVNGDVWGKDVLFDKTYGDMISYADKTFGVKSFINGTQISDGTQIGNYIYHPTGIVQLTFNPIVKPDVWAHSGGYRPRNKIETSLPVFRVEDAKVGQYGTYGVEHREGEDKLVLSATGMRLPEPDQVPDEERTFTTTLSTEEGSGTFKLEYNGVSLKVHPQDKKAEEVVRAGDKTKNVSLSEKALYVGYTEMGLDLIDLKGVYIYFN